MRVVATIRSEETRRIEVDADTYEEGRRKFEAEVPPGWQVLSYRADRDTK
jgi:hypothetical protein